MDAGVELEEYRCDSFASLRSFIFTLIESFGIIEFSAGVLVVVGVTIEAGCVRDVDARVTITFGCIGVASTATGVEEDSTAADNGSDDDDDGDDVVELKNEQFLSRTCLPSS